MTGLLVEEYPLQLSNWNRPGSSRPQQPITVLFEGYNSGVVKKAILNSSTTISQIKLKVRNVSDCNFVSTELTTLHYISSLRLQAAPYLDR
jgi:hypothetical protein